MKREIAAVVVLCAACVEGANRLDGHKGKHTLTLSVRDRTPEKKKGKEAGDVEEQSSERKSTRGPAEREFFSEESAFATSLRQKRMKIAQGTRVATLVKRAVSKIGPLVHRDDSRFVSTDTPPFSLSLSLSLSLCLCYSHSCQHSAISMRRRVMLPCSNFHRRATLFLRRRVMLPCSNFHRRATLCDCGA